MHGATIKIINSQVEEYDELMENYFEKGARILLGS